jgi:hypothetical protein
MSDVLRQASWSLLRRMIHYYHFVITEPSAGSMGANTPGMHSCIMLPFGILKSLPAPELTHIPQITTMQGLVDVFSVCNVIELAEIFALASSRGLSDYDIQQNVEARRLSRRIIAWVHSRFTFTDESGSPLDLYADLCIPYLVQHARILCDYKRVISSLSPVSVSPELIEANIQASFAQHALFRHHWSKMQNLTLETLSWPEDLQFNVIERCVPEGVDLGTRFILFTFPLSSDCHRCQSQI